MENFIKEAKDGFGFDQMKSHDYIVNEAHMMISLLAYNLTNWLRTLSFPFFIDNKRTNIQVVLPMISHQETLTLSPYMAIYDIVVPKDHLLREIKKRSKSSLQSR